MIFHAWAFVEAPTSGMLITVVLLTNLGGVYNCVAYTVIRRRLQQQKALRGPQVVVRGGTTSAYGVGSVFD